MRLSIPLRYLFHAFEWICRFSKVPKQCLGVFLSVLSSKWISNTDCSTVTPRLTASRFSNKPVKVNGFAVATMASLYVAILALSAHEQDIRKRAALFTLAHYYKLRSNRQYASIRRATRLGEWCSKFCAGLSARHSWWPLRKCCCCTP